MKPVFPFLGRRTTLSGDVVSIRFTIDFRNGREVDQEVWNFLQETRGELESDTKQAVEKILGPEFEVRSISFRRGSIEIIIIIGTVYYAISRYKNFIESIEMLVSQLKSLFQRFFGRFGPQPLSVHGTWSPGPALARAETIMSYGAIDGTMILLWYIILSHAALLSVFIWMLLNR
ncbi:MAG: hypothetical protein HY961_14505 [Ignavibacteriae bacterium]|nr:hypothetical protein [Ignavibacteriota bacterium]